MLRKCNGADLDSNETSMTKGTVPFVIYRSSKPSR